MPSDSRFRRQHDRIHALIDRCGNVARFRPGWRRILDHAFQHLRGHDDWLSGIAGDPHNLALDQRDFFRREFHTEIAAGNHYGVCGGNNAIQIINRSRLFELGHNHRLIADQAARFLDIGNRLHKGERDDIDPHVECEGEIAAILFRQGRNGQRLAAHREPFAILQHTR